MKLPADDKIGAWNTFSPGPVQKLTTAADQPQLSMLRLDLIQSWASGNKYYKLKYTIEFALKHGITTLVSKGGMFSNHLAALAQACSMFEINLIALVRSHMPDENNPSIQRLRAWNSEIFFLNSEAYTAFDASASQYHYPGALFIPEGGLSDLGLRGAAEIVAELTPHHPTHVVVAGGSMSTACGILSAAPSSMKVVIVPSWKGCTVSYISNVLETYGLASGCPWELWPEYHFGGFGRFNQSLIDFMSTFSATTSIPLEPVYTGKLMYAVDEKIKSGYFKATDSIMAIHSGGLQGLEGYRYRFPEEWG